MSIIINHNSAADEPGAPFPEPSPEQLAAVFAYVDQLVGLYGPDRGTWPDPAEWPEPMLADAR